MPRDAEPPIRLRVQRTRYGHWGARSGYVRFVDALDPARCAATLCSAPDDHSDFPALLRPLRPWARRRLRRSGMPWHKLSDTVAEARAFAACVAGRVDVAHFLDGEHAPLLLPHLLRRAGLSRPAVVATFHQPAGLLGDLVAPAVLRALDAIVVMAPSQRAFFERHAPPERIHVIPHGIDVEFFRPGPSRRPPGPPRCLTVGHWLRDWAVFEAVARMTPDVEFEAICGRPIRGETLPNVRRRTGLDDAALAQAYRDADILFMPLLDATANNGLLEGAASGLPSVATDLSAVRAYLPDGAVLTAPPKRPDLMASAIARLAGDRELRARMGEEARRRAETLAWPIIAKRHLQLYETLARREAV